MSDLSDFCLRARMLLGLSQEEFADIVGSSVSSVSRWETGKSNPTPEMIRKLRRMVITSRPFSNSHYVKASPTYKVAVDLKDLNKIVLASNGFLRGPGRGQTFEEFRDAPRSEHYRRLVKEIEAHPAWRKQQVAYIHSVHRASCYWLEMIGVVGHVAGFLLWEMMPTKRKEYLCRITTIDEVEMTHATPGRRFPEGFAHVAHFGDKDVIDPLNQRNRAP